MGSKFGNFEVYLNVPASSELKFYDFARVLVFSDRAPVWMPGNFKSF